MYDTKETTQEAALRLGLSPEFTAMHEGDHKCIDGRRYVVSCLITDPDCDDIARGRLPWLCPCGTRNQAEAADCTACGISKSRAAGMLHRPCEGCNAEPGEACRPGCLGNVA